MRKFQVTKTVKYSAASMMIGASPLPAEVVTVEAEVVTVEAEDFTTHDGILSFYNEDGNKCYCLAAGEWSSCIEVKDGGM